MIATGTTGFAADAVLVRHGERSVDTVAHGGPAPLIGAVALGLDVAGLPGMEWLMLLSFCAWVVSLIGCVPGIAGRATLHDLVARTKVVKCTASSAGSSARDHSEVT